MMGNNVPSWEPDLRDDFNLFLKVTFVRVPLTSYTKDNSARLSSDLFFG